MNKLLTVDMQIKGDFILKQVMCLLYHRVNDLKKDIYGITISSENFQSHMRYLSRTYKILRFEDDWNKINDEKAVVITFDDGYRDNYEIAWPICQKYQVPATFFISTEGIESGNEVWTDNLVTLLLQDRNYPSQFTLSDKDFSYTWRTKTKEDRVDLVKSLRWLLRMNMDENKLSNWIEQLKEWSGFQYNKDNDNRMMTLHELQMMSNDRLVTIGGHTKKHMSLGAMDYEKQRIEIEGSVKYLEDNINKKIEVFSYPFGGTSDYTEDTIKICKSIGIKKAATTTVGVWNEDNREYEIPRISVGDWTIKKLIEQMETCWKG